MDLSRRVSNMCDRYVVRHLQRAPAGADTCRLRTGCMPPHAHSHGIPIPSLATRRGGIVTWAETRGMTLVWGDDAPTKM